MKTMELLKKFKNLAIYAALEMLLWSVPAGSRRSKCAIGITYLVV